MEYGIEPVKQFPPPQNLLEHQKSTGWLFRHKGDGYQTRPKLVAVSNLFTCFSSRIGTFRVYGQIDNLQIFAIELNHKNVPGSSKGCWMDDKGCLYTIP